RRRRAARGRLRLPLQRHRRAHTPAGDADRDRHDGDAAADLPLNRADAAEPAPKLDPLDRQVQPGQLGSRSRPLGDRTRHALGANRDPRRLPHAAPARQRRIRHSRLQRIPTLRLTTQREENHMAIAALSWPAASIYIALIIAVALVVAVLIWSIFRTGQTAIGRDKRRRESNDKRPATAREA